jgi:hypothetical protein
MLQVPHLSRFSPSLVLVALFLSSAAQAQDRPSGKSKKSSWSFSAANDLYVIPGGRDYAQPTIAADRGWFHLEARYNYETLESASIWLGYNIRTGKKVTLALTPMLSAVFGKTTGIAPGYELLVNWRKLELYSEGEWVFNVYDRTDSFVFAWSELTVTPIDWLCFGIVGQRTRVFDGERDIQRGVLLRVLHKRLALTGHAFNPETSKPLYVFSVGVEL